MRKATIILRLIDDLERELYGNYTYKQIQTAIQKEAKNRSFLGISNGLVNVINNITMEG